MRRSVLLVFLVPAVVACSALGAATAPTVTVGSAPETTSTSTTQFTPARVCRHPAPVDPFVNRFSGGDPVAFALAVSRASFACADDVVLTTAEDAGSLAVAAQLAAALDGPLLIGTAATMVSVEREIARLDPERVTVVGGFLLPAVAAGVAVERHEGSLDDLADIVRRKIGASTRVGLADSGSRAFAEVLVSIATGRSVTVPLRAPVQGCGEGRSGIREAIERAAGVPGGRGRVWLVDACSPVAAVTAAAAVGGGGGTVLLVDGRDLRAIEPLVVALRDLPLESTGLYLVGQVTSDAEWQLRSVRSGMDLPGGGLLLFPSRRIVSLYGNPTTRWLGVLGEQDPDQSVIRARRVAAGYATAGTTIVPGFEVIATVASSKAGDDGDYSWEMTVEELRPWIEVAAREGVYVTLDLQPGRTDFLTQARRYEELLVLPHVGLALDPEWRLQPDQRHLRQIGSVDAEEVNRVVDYLAGLVREHALPQKLLLLHQFKLSMITNRELIKAPPELAVVVHADGQGPIHTKYDTWRALHAPPDASRWWWGWKNFYDEDSPTPTPDQVLDLDPVPVYVSYQ